MKPSHVLSLILASLCAPSIQAISQENLDEWVSKYDLMDGDVAAALRQVKTFPAILNLQATASLSRTITLKMQPSRVVAGEAPDDLKDSFFVGTVEGFPRSKASLTVWPSGLTGRIRMEDANGRIYVLSIDNLAGVAKTVIYNNADYKEAYFVNAQLRDDAVTRYKKDAGASVNALSAAPPIRTPQRITGGLNCRMALIADSSFAAQFGDETQKQMVSILNDVSAIMSTTFNINLPVSVIAIDKNDKLGFGNNGLANTGVISELLQEASTVLDKEQDRMKNICLTHVFTARTVGTTLGVAFVAKPDTNTLGGICSGSSAVGVSTIKSATGGDIPASARVTTVAHEIGHGFGSNHDVDPSCVNSIMAAAVRLGGPPVTQFSRCSIQSIRTVLASKSNCLVPSQ